MILKYSIGIILFFSINLCFATANSPDSDINTVLEELVVEINKIEAFYENTNSSIATELKKVSKALLNTTKIEEQVTLLIKKEQLKEQLNFNNRAKASDISKIRYLKGLEIIKILYEKTLALDHHFASVATFNEINNLSNPNHYPEFTKLKDILSNKEDKKKGFGLSSILGDNIYTSVLHSFVSLFNSDNASKKEKEASLKDVECILDFTLRMHNDLNTIYFETAFLQKSNDNVIKELEALFVDYTKPIKYKVALKACRNTDDWDTVRERLADYLEILDKITREETKRYKAHKMQINLGFPIDRLLQFITLYNNHIDQGAKFYEKFGIMLNSYENEKQCATKIPVEYTKLKDNIKISIEKFNTAYKPVEINGSKMKEVLYGVSEYD